MSYRKNYPLDQPGCYRPVLFSRLWAGRNATANPDRPTCSASNSKSHPTQRRPNRYQRPRRCPRRRRPSPLTPTPWPQVIVPGPNDVHALLVLPDGLGPNWYLNADNFESYGWAITLTGVAQAIVRHALRQSTGMACRMCRWMCSWVISQTRANIQVVAIMPATKKVADAYGDLLGSPAALSLLGAADQAGTALYASCGGVRVLAAAAVSGRSPGHR